MDDLDLDDQVGVMGDLSSFDRKLKAGQQMQADSSDEDDGVMPIDRKNPMAIMEEKNQILIDRLYKAEKELGDMRGTYEAITGDSESLKDKKIIELAKKNRALQLQADGLKTKAAKAAELVNLQKGAETSGAVPFI